MGWKDRLRQLITLTSPDGTKYIAHWAANDIAGNMRVGLFNYPLIDETVSQYLGTDSDKYALTLQFEGDDNDIAAMQFKRGLRAKGPHGETTWTVVHPVYGSLQLQPLGSVTLKADPTTSGNITVVETNWIEVPSQSPAVSPIELASKITAQAQAANNAALSDFLSGTDLTDAASVAATQSTAQSLADAFKASAIGKLITATSDLAGKFTTAYNTLSSDIQAATLDPVKVAADIQALVGLASSAATDLPSLVTACIGFVASIVDDYLPSGNDAAAKNQVQTAEIFAVAGIAATAGAVVATLPATRNDCVNVASSFAASFLSTIEALDAVQAAFAGQPLAVQYFSELGSYTALAALVGMTVQYLLAILFDLKIARTFTLDRPKPPIRIVLEEYGAEYDAVGNDNLALFIATNNLTGRDIILLPAGRSVTVYEAVA